MHCTQRICFCDYRWLWMQTIIVVTITAIDAKQNSVKSVFQTTISNNTESIETTNKIHKSFEEKIILNSTQRTFSRPSSILKQLWSSASKAINNNSTDNDIQNNNSSQNIALKLKDILFRPLKWSSDIVPSIPLGLQWSTDAIYLSPHPSNGITESSATNGDITVINGLYSPAISYPKEYKTPNRTESTSDPKTSVVTPSNSLEFYSTIHNSNEDFTTLESINSEITLPLVDSQPNITTNSIFSTNITTNPILNISIPSRIITTTATINSPTEPIVGRRSGQLVDTLTTSTTKPVIHTIDIWAERSKQSAPEARRQAIRQRFSTPEPEFGARISRMPPKVSIDSFLSVYKPLLKPNVWDQSLKFGLNPKISSSTEMPTNSTENNLKTLKPFLISIAYNSGNNLTNNSTLKDKPNVELKDQLMTTSETSYSLSSVIRLPSRPKPSLKPKLSNNSDDCYNNKVKECMTNVLNSSRLDSNNLVQNVSNVSTNSNNSVSERRNVNQIITLDSKRDLFGLRMKAIENSRNKKDLTTESNQSIDSKTNSDSEAKHLLEPIDGDSYEDPQSYSEVTPIILAEPEEFIPLDQFINTQKEYKDIFRHQKLNEKYKILPNPLLFKDELDKNVNPVYNKPGGVIGNPTLPNKVMKFESMMRQLAQVMRSINRLNPIGKSLADNYKQLASRVRSNIYTKEKGAYAQYYPPGYYDDIYEPDQVDPDDEKFRRSDDYGSASEINETYVESPNNYTNIDSIDDINTDNNNSYAYNDYDDDGLIKKSFGYRVTVYRSPENGKSNVTEEVLADKGLNGNKEDDLSVSESSDEFGVTTDSNDSETQLTSESNLSKSGTQSGLKGNALGVDYKRNKYNRERGSHAREEMNANKSKKVDTHDRRANNERALKERTIIEFFEREHILDSAYNKDKLAIDKPGHHNYVDEQMSGSVANPISGPDGTVPKTGTINSGETHEYSNSDKSHVTNGETFDTVFPEHDRKYKHKDNAHKYKGWKERGYKIITETEFVDRGRKVDTGYKKHLNGSREHIKEHSAGDVTKGDLKTYRKNIKHINKNYENLYGNKVKPTISYENMDKDAVNEDNIRKYYYNNGLNSGDAERITYANREQPLQTQDVPHEETTTLSAILESDKTNNESTDGFRMPEIDTENLWRPIIRTADHLGVNHDYYPKVKHIYNDNNNVYPNDNMNQFYDQNHKNRHYISTTKAIPSISSEVYGYRINPYSLPLISEESHYNTGANPNDQNVGHKEHYYAIKNHNQDYYYESTPNPIYNHNQNQNQNDFYDNNNHESNNQLNGSSIINDNNIYNNEFRYTHTYYPNSTYLRATNDNYHQQQSAPEHSGVIEISPVDHTPMSMPTGQPYFEYQVYPPVNENSLKSNNHLIDDKLMDRPLFALIGDESKNIQKFKPNDGSFGSRRPDSMLVSDVNKEKAPNFKYEDYRANSVTTARPFRNDKHTYAKPIKINTRIPRPDRPDRPDRPIFTPNANPKRPKPKARPMRKKPKNYNLYERTPIDDLLLNADTIQPIQPQTQSLYQFLRPYGRIPNTPLRPPTRIPIPTVADTLDTLFAESEQPVAILHPNKMLTFTTTAKLRNKFGSQFMFNKIPNPFRWVTNSGNNLGKKLVKTKRRQRSTPFKFRLFSRNTIERQSQSSKQKSSFRGWFRSKFQKNKIKT